MKKENKHSSSSLKRQPSEAIEMQPVGEASSYAVSEHRRKNNEAEKQFAAFLNTIKKLPLETKETKLTAQQKALEEENRKIAAAFVLLYADRGMSPVSVIKAYITQAYGAEITTDPYNAKAKALLDELPEMTAWPVSSTGDQNNYFSGFEFPAEFSFSGDVNQLKGSASWRVPAVESSNNIYSKFLAHAYHLNSNVFTAHPTESVIILEIIWQQLPVQKRIELCQGDAKARLPGFAFNWLKEKSFYQLHYAEKETSLLAGLSDSDFHINFAYGSVPIAALLFYLIQLPSVQAALSPAHAALTSSHSFLNSVLSVLNSIFNTIVNDVLLKSMLPILIISMVFGAFYYLLFRNTDENDAGKRWSIGVQNTGLISLFTFYLAGTFSFSILHGAKETFKELMPVFYGFLSLAFAGRQLYKIVLRPMAEECLSTSAPKAASAWLTVSVTLGVAAAVIVPLLVFAPAVLPFLASHAYIMPLVATLISPLLRCEAVRTRPALAAAIRGVVMGALLLSMTASTLYIAASFLSSNVLLGVKGAALGAALFSGPVGWIVLAVVFLAVLATVHFAYNKYLVNPNSGKGMAAKILLPVPLSGANVSAVYGPDLGAPKPENPVAKAIEKFGGGRNNSRSEPASRPANLQQPGNAPQSPQEAATTTTR